MKVKKSISASATKLKMMQMVMMFFPQVRNRLHQKSSRRGFRLHSLDWVSQKTHFFITFQLPRPSQKPFRLWGWTLVKILNMRFIGLFLVKILRLKFGWDFQIEFWRWSLVENLKLVGRFVDILKLICDQDWGKNFWCGLKVDAL